MGSDQPRSTVTERALRRLAARAANPSRAGGARRNRDHVRNRNHLWNRNDVLIAGATAVIDIVGVFAIGGGDRPSVTPARLLLFVVASVLLTVRRRYPAQVFAGVLAMQLAYTFSGPTEHAFGASTGVALYTVVRYCDRYQPAVAVVATLGTQLARAVRADDLLMWTVLGDAMTVGLVVATGIGVRQWQHQLTINRRLLADRAVSEERQRIARELHDIVAHHITTMYLMSGGARSTLDRDPETARAALITLEGSGRTALREMRQLLGVLRSTDAPEEAPSAPQPGVDEIARLIAESCAAGLPTEFEVTGATRPLPPTTGLTLYRIVQEALTNARKHAGDTRARVRLDYLPDKVAIEVCDDGVGRGGRGGSVMAGGGYGLLGMRERVAVHGGTLEAGRRDEGGYRVAVTVPVPPKEDEQEWPR